MDYSKYPQNDILCIDMRSFYASVEAVRLGLDPLTVMLAVVGDLSRPGSIVLAASPTLKKVYGINNVSRYFELPKSADIHYVQANMADYLHASLQITKLLNRFAPQEAIHQYSIDEVWLTANGLEKIFGNRFRLAEQIKEAILLEFGLPSTIGIGDNKFLAKVVLDLYAKKAKNSIAECTYETVPTMLWDVPVHKIWGIGRKIERRLRRLGITTFGQIAHYPLEQLKEHFGVIGEQLYWHAWGIDLSPVMGDFTKTVHKSFGHGISLLRNYSATETHICILELCEEACRRARQENLFGKTVHLSIQYANNNNGFSRSLSLQAPTNITLEVYQACLQIFNTFYDGHSEIRRVNVSLTNLFSDVYVQLDLFNERPKQQDIGYVMDEIRERFGSTAILRAVSYTDAGITLDRSKKIGGHWA